MAMRAIIAAALVACAAAEGHVAAKTYEVTDTGYKVDGKDVAVGDGIKIADDQNIKQGKLGAIFGTKLASAESAYKVGEINARAAMMAKEVKAMKDEIALIKSGGGGEGVKPALIKGVMPCKGGCGTHGANMFPVMLQGEIFSKISGLVSCHFKVGSKTVLTLPGMGKITGNSGKYSMVMCPDGPFPAGIAAGSSKFDAEVSIDDGSQALKSVGDKVFKVTFQRSGPRIIESPVDAPGLKVDENGWVKIFGMEAPNAQTCIPFVANDADSTFSSFKGTVTHFGTTQKSVVVKKIKDLSQEKGRKVGDFLAHLCLTHDLTKTTPQQFTLKIVLSDGSNDGTPFTMKVSYRKCICDLIMKFSTYRGKSPNKIHQYDDKDWWEGTAPVNANMAADGKWETFGDDIKTQYHSQPIGKKLSIIHSFKNKVVAATVYNIDSKFQKLSLRDLVTGSRNNVVGKKDMTASKGVKMRGGRLSTRDGNCRPNTGDPFVDTSNDLIVNTFKKYHRDQGVDEQRINTVYKGCQGHHIYGGIGGKHKQGGWNIQYEAMPVVGYCHTWNGYGHPSQYSDSHAKFNFEYKLGNEGPYKNCADRSRLINVDVSVYQGIYYGTIHK